MEIVIFLFVMDKLMTIMNLSEENFTCPMNILAFSFLCLNNSHF